jgi:hypothetical protein
MRRTQHRKHRDGRGQALVEFSLIIPLFLMIVVGILEFSVLLTVDLGLTSATQDATRMAAQMGNSADADFQILNTIETDLQAPVSKERIDTVKIFWTNPEGTVLASSVYRRVGTLWNTAHTESLPYSQISGGYPPPARCVIVSGVGCTAGHGGVDWIGVSIAYQYAWMTPAPGLVGLGGAAPLMNITSTSRMEPIQ